LLAGLLLSAWFNAGCNASAGQADGVYQQ